MKLPIHSQLYFALCLYETEVFFQVVALQWKEPITSITPTVPVPITCVLCDGPADPGVKCTCVAFTGQFYYGFESFVVDDDLKSFKAMRYGRVQQCTAAADAGRSTGLHMKSDM